MIYLDFAATTPISEQALYVFTEASKKYFANSSSLHELGTTAKNMLDNSRKAWAEMIKGKEEGVYFTSGGTESNQLALRSLIEGNRNRGNHIITTEVEHASVDELFKQLKEEGFNVTYLSLNQKGQIDLEELEKSIRSDTILASIHYVNGETGFIQPVKRIGEILEKHNVLFHSDCVQAFGSLNIDVKQFKMDSLSISSHKIYGPKGTGLAYINPRVHWSPIYKNATHESGFRPGTVDVPSILSFTAAGQIAIQSMEEKQLRMYKLRENFIQRLSKYVKHFTVYESELEQQLPQIIGLSIGRLQGQFIMLECNKYGVAISTGSACQVGQQSPSRTLLSLQKTRDEANQFVRLSFGKETTDEHLNKAVKVMANIVNAT